jgi:cobalt-zinc-cadmium efflux system protein
VLDIHALHVWTVTSGMESATAHLSVADGTDAATVLGAARHALADHGISHATVQVETDGSHCHNMTW